MANKIQQAVGRNAPYVDVLPTPIIAQRAPTTADTNYAKGQPWIDESVSSPVIYLHNGGGTWTANNLTLSTDATFAGAVDTTASSSLAIKTYADNLAIAGAPDASTTVKGIVEEGLDAEVLAGTATGGTGARLFVNPGSLAALFASPPAMGGTSEGAGTFSTLAATGAVDFDAGGSWESAGTTIAIGSDADTAAINLGVGAAARTITMGNISAGTALALNSGTGHITLTSTGTGDIIINSDDTLLLDSDGVLELNSSAAAINIGNDADAFGINIGTGAAARTITMGNSTGATSLVLNSGTGAINIGTNAIAHTVTIGNKTGATALVLNAGTGNYVLDGVAGTTYTVGATTTGGTITIGGTAQTGTMTLGDSSGVNIVQIGSGEGATTVNIAGGATAAKAVTIATGAVASTVAIGSGSSGAITVDTAAGISLDAATASNFTVTGAADLTLRSTAGSVDINGEKAAVDAISLQSAAGGLDVNTALEINIDSSEAAVADAIRIVASAADGGIDIDTGTGGLTLDSTGIISIDAADDSNVTVTGAGKNLTLNSVLGSVIISSTEDVADNIYLHANGGVSETIKIHSDLGTGVASINVLSDVGGITLTSGLASADAINLAASAGGVDIDGALEVNIASSQAASSAITLAASDAAGGITHTGKCIYTPDAITSANTGVAASVSTVVTEITTNGDSDLDNVTLAAGVDGQVKIFAVVAVGNAADSIKITPASLIGGTQITFAANPLGLGCQMYYDAGVAGWIITGNNGGTVA